MIWINPQNRQPLEEFHRILYAYLKATDRRYSDQRERVLKLLYLQASPLSTGAIYRRLKEEYPDIGYATVARHLLFFNQIGWLHVFQRRYLLKAESAILETCG